MQEPADAAAEDETLRTEKHGQVGVGAAPQRASGPIHAASKPSSCSPAPAHSFTVRGADRVFDTIAAGHLSGESIIKFSSISRKANISAIACVVFHRVGPKFMVYKRFF